MKKIIPVVMFLSLSALLFTSSYAINVSSTSQTSAAEIIRKTLAKDGIEKAKQIFAKMRRAPQGSYSPCNSYY